MSLSASIIDAARDAAKAFPGDLNKAKEKAEMDIRALPEFPEYQEHLVRKAIDNLVYSCRQELCRKVRNGWSQEHHPEIKEQADKQANRQSGVKPINQFAKPVQDIYAKYYDYMIAGTRLGSLHGSELLAVANNQKKRAEGCMYNVRLLKMLKPLVPDDKTVDEAVSGKKIQAVFDRMKPAELVEV